MPRNKLNTRLRLIVSASVLAALGTAAHEGANGAAVRAASGVGNESAARTRTVSRSYVLNKKLATMTGDEFYTWVNDQTNGPEWSGTPLTLGRKCTHWKCYVGSQLTQVVIDAAKEAWRFDLDAIPDNGVVVATLSILETTPKLPKERRYKLEPDGKDYTYYFVVEPQSKTYEGHKTGLWSLVEVNQKKHKVLSTGTFHRCKYATSADGAHAGFSKCGDGTRVVSHARVDSLLRRLQLIEAQVKSAARDAEAAQVRSRIAAEFIDSQSGPAWISCIHGCCVADEY